MRRKLIRILVTIVFDLPKVGLEYSRMLYSLYIRILYSMVRVRSTGFMKTYDEDVLTHVSEVLEDNL